MRETITVGETALVDPVKRIRGKLSLNKVKTNGISQCPLFFQYYIELITAPGKTQEDLSSVIAELDQLEADVVATLLRPKQFGLIPRK
uniref:Uncharacterized protein n=1 Tax=Caenorhabditis japonica TaxID=281687 RepID=A0A8R1IN06_CAEJA